MPGPIELFTWATPNGRKISIALEELELPYTIRKIDLRTEAQFEPEFLRISPNGKIPAIVDHEGPNGAAISLCESGAILIYLAEKCGRLMPTDSRTRYEMLQWLMFQMGSIGPMFGQAHHFRKFLDKEVPYAIRRYTDETRRLYGVLERRLSVTEFVAGEYSIADIAIFPWVARYPWQGVELDEFQSVQRWFNGIAERPAVIRGRAVPQI